MHDPCLISLADLQIGGCDDRYIGFFVYSFIRKYLLSFSTVPGMVLDAGYSAKNKINVTP